MAITYNAGTNTITVTGYTFGTPCTFLDVYNADVAGGWGVVSKSGNDHFTFDCKLVIGDGSTSTYFADTDKQIIFSTNSITADYQIAVYVMNSANFTLGYLVNDSKKVTDNGCALFGTFTQNSFLLNVQSSSAVVKLYSCLVHGTDGSGVSSIISISGATVYNCIFDHLYLYLSANLTIYNLLATSSKTYGLYGSSGTWDVVNLKNHDYAIGFGYAGGGQPPGNQHVKNTIIKNNTYVARCHFMGLDCSITNGDVDNWNFVWSNSSAKVYRKYELDLKVIDKDNTPINAATVKVWDKDSNLIVDTTTNASGVIVTQAITRGYYNQANGNTLQEASPHLIKIEKAGYTTYEADFTLDDKKDWLIALQVGGGGLLRNPPMAGGMV